MLIEERAHCASIAADSLITSHTISPSEESIHPDPIQGSRHPPRSLSQPEGNLKVPRSYPLRQETGNSSLKPTNQATNWYNLRLKRSRNYWVGKARFLVNHFYFPHFFKSCKNHLKSHGVPDRDCIAPSHSPMPDSSDLSPSVVSTLPSPASSLELFGLEARSISPTEHSVDMAKSNYFPKM
ncbi:uncharacterized protein BDCG_05390 [Blastomyces dermatitidis ER-3]|uniref:Uncharacterized protein n=1 Tax=Ajellomyces dermatitidis (strain ER-3 / ATCC MYA-2586) TaxID=559297 RepID=A0ABP2F4I7_AJEDR|nr:uncharacterized protein BDCG_05390 [Blastomyces dermatitidis ER-3]EEQ90270.2 hypothetical protein BDCG_05390 [Blastomyces dermatitidis ER-3]